jgi:hypothetical protein
MTIPFLRHNQNPALETFVASTLENPRVGQPSFILFMLRVERVCQPPEPTDAIRIPPAKLPQD